MYRTMMSLASASLALLIGTGRAIAQDTVSGAARPFGFP
jgi:hypothetical protein